MLALAPATITLTGSTQVTSAMDSVLVNAPTITDASAVVVDKAATVTITGAPVAAGSVSITDPVALSVNSGRSSFGGDVGVASGSKVGLEGTQGDSYMVYDSTSGKLKVFVNGQAVAWFRD